MESYNGFEIGDHIRRTAGYHGGMNPGDTGTIVSLKNGHIYFKSYKEILGGPSNPGHDPKMFELASQPVKTSIQLAIESAVNTLKGGR